MAKSKHSQTYILEEGGRGSEEAYQKEVKYVLNAGAFVRMTTIEKCGYFIIIVMLMILLLLPIIIYYN